jgi:hypothetical protein
MLARQTSCFCGCCALRPPPQASNGPTRAGRCSFIRAFRRLTHASLEGNPRANRTVRFGLLVPQRTLSDGWELLHRALAGLTPFGLRHVRLAIPEVHAILQGFPSAAGLTGSWCSRRERKTALT